MRIVVDTNVLVSALLVPGSVPGQCVQLGIAKRFQWLVDHRIVAEYRDVLQRPEFDFDPPTLGRLFATVELDTEWIVADPLPIRIADESDLPFLEVAVAGGADALVTGNARHFQLKEGRLAIPIVSPRQFLHLLGGRA